MKSARVSSRLCSNTERQVLTDDVMHVVHNIAPADKSSRSMRMRLIQVHDIQIGKSLTCWQPGLQHCYVTGTHAISDEALMRCPSLCNWMFCERRYVAVTGPWSRQ